MRMDVKVLLWPDVHLWKHKGRAEIPTGAKPNPTFSAGTLFSGPCELVMLVAS